MPKKSAVTIKVSRVDRDLGAKLLRQFRALNPHTAYRTHGDIYAKGREAVHAEMSTAIPKPNPTPSQLEKK